MTDDRRAIRLNNRFVEPREFECPEQHAWGTSAKGNPFVKIGNTVLVVSALKYKEGEYTFSYAIDGDVESDGRQIWHRPPPPNVFQTIDHAKRAALAAIGALRPQRLEEVELDREDDDAGGDKVVPHRETGRRIRVD